MQFWLARNKRVIAGTLGIAIAAAAAWRRAFMMGKELPYTDGLQFESRPDDTADVDEVTMTPMMKSAAAQAADAIRGGERS